MADPFIGEVRIMGFNFAPTGWATCDGQLLAISQNTALFSILGTMYGGNGITTYALPDLKGRIPLHRGQGPGLSNYDQGEIGGDSTVTLQLLEMPVHNHRAACSTTGAPSTNPTDHFWGEVPTLNLYRNGADAKLNVQALSLTGGNQPHNNLQPYLSLNFCIALKGVFPPRN